MDAEFVRYKFEDRFDGVIIKNKFKIGIRHVQILYMFVCSFVFGALRSSNSIAILAIADYTRRNDTFIQVHDWNRRIQGTILSSFFFGYALMLVPAEFVTRRVGGKWVLTIALLTMGSLCCAMPTIANRGGWVAVCNAEFLQGMMQAYLSPASNVLLKVWLPPNERRTLSWFVNAGLHLGIIIGLPIAGWISADRLGWELVFYSQGMMALSMATIWGILTGNSPEDHAAAGDSEKEFIKEALSYYREKTTPKPYCHILRSRAFWAIAAAHASSNILFLFFLDDVPAFYQAAGLSIRDSSLHAMFPFIVMWLVQVTSAPTVDHIYRLGYAAYVINVNHFRRTVYAIGVFGIVIGLTLIPSLVSNSINFVTVAMSAILGSLGFLFCGFLENHRDISENYNGTLLMMSRCIASIAGALTPLATGFIMGQDVTDMKQWRLCLLLLVTALVTSSVVYCTLGSAERQPWDTDRKKFGYHNETNHLELEDIEHNKPQETREKVPSAT